MNIVILDLKLDDVIEETSTDSCLEVADKCNDDNLGDKRRVVLVRSFVLFHFLKCKYRKKGIC